MTMARIQPFCRANNINLGYFNGIRVFPRSVTDRNNDDNESKYDDYGDIQEEEINNHIEKNLGELPIHQFF